MKTLFFCEELNYRSVRFDTKIYSLDQRYIITRDNKKYFTRVTSIKFNRDGTREIILELEKDNVKREEKKIPVEVSSHTTSWIDKLIKDIEGKRGRVYWYRRKRKRKY